MRTRFMMSKNQSWFYPWVVAVEMPVGLNHLDTDFCWCDPVIEIDENGGTIVLHKQVVWN